MKTFWDCNLHNESFQMMYYICQKHDVHRVITIQNLCHAWAILMAAHFLHQNWGKRMDFLIFIFPSEDKILEPSSFQVFTTIKWWQWKWFIICKMIYFFLKIVDEFLASCYASLLTKCSYFAWSITSQNLNLKKSLFVGNSMKSSICLLNLKKICMVVGLFHFFFIRLT